MDKLDLILEKLDTMQKDIEELKAMRDDVADVKEGLDEVRGGVNTLLGWADDVACVVKVPLKPAN